MMGEMYMKFLQDKFTKENSCIQMWKKDGWLSADVPIQVGFDFVKLKLQLSYIDWNVFEQAQDVVNVGEGKFIWGNETNDIDNALNICTDPECNKMYTSIKIDLWNNDVLTIKTNKRSGIDNCQLDLHIKPHRYLGNIYNNSAEEEKAYVLERLHEIEQMSGIYFNHDFVEVIYAEINMNFLFDFDTMNFEEIVKSLGVYQIKNGKSSNNIYTVSDMKKGLVNSIAYTDIGQRAISIYTKYRDFDSVIYDKSFETKRGYNFKYNEKIDKLDMIQSNCMRIEFKIKKDGIQRYFGNINLMEYEQNTIEEVFKSLFEKNIYNEVEEYYIEWDKIIQQAFMRVDMTDPHKRATWKKDIIAKISSQIKSDTNGFIYITPEDMKAYVKLIPSKSAIKNAKKITEQLIDEIEKNHKHSIKIVDEKPYKLIRDFIINFSGKQEQTIWYLPNKSIT